MLLRRLITAFVIVGAANVVNGFCVKGCGKSLLQQTAGVRVSPSLSLLSSPSLSSPPSFSCTTWLAGGYGSCNERSSSRLILYDQVKAAAVEMDAESTTLDGSTDPDPTVAPVVVVNADSMQIIDNDTEGYLNESTRKIVNAIFLIASFGYAFYTILNIDSAITRGWTQSEIAMRIPLDNWSNYEASLAAYPVFTKTLINVIIYLLGDWLSQTAFQGKNVLDFDVGRTLRNGFIGLCFGPLVHQYYEFSDYILPVEGGLMNRIEKVFMDQTIYLTVKCSIYISAVGLLQGDDWETVKQSVKDKIGGVVITAWKFWPLVHCITYGLIPARHRILWVNSVDLIWNAILATQATKKDDTEEEELVSQESTSVQPLLKADIQSDAEEKEETTVSVSPLVSTPLLLEELSQDDELRFLSKEDSQDIIDMSSKSFNRTDAVLLPE